MKNNEKSKWSELNKEKHVHTQKKKNWKSQESDSKYKK